MTCEESNWCASQWGLARLWGLRKGCRSHSLGLSCHTQCEAMPRHAKWHWKGSQRIREREGKGRIECSPLALCSSCLLSRPCWSQRYYKRRRSQTEKPGDEAKWRRYNFPTNAGCFTKVSGHRTNIKWFFFLTERLTRACWSDTSKWDWIVVQ